MVCTQGLKVTAEPVSPPPTKVSGRVMRSKKAERYSVFINHPGAEMPKMFRLFSTPPPMNQPSRWNDGVVARVGPPARLDKEVPDHSEPV
jgi:hypothetical protein